MSMIHELALLNFRGVKEGHLELFPMTVLLGANNSGKTTVLEALYLLYPFEISCLSTYARKKGRERRAHVLTVAEAVHVYHEILGS